MVRFTEDKIIVEIPAGNPFYEYLEILHAVNAIGWFVADYGESDGAGAKAFSKLSFYVGAALTEMEHKEAMHIDNFLRDSELHGEVESRNLTEQE